MQTNNQILMTIKQLVKNIEPNAKIILYGSFARGDNNNNSDIDLLILVDQNNITYQYEKQIKYPLYDLEFDTGQIISPLILSKTEFQSSG